MIEDRPEGARHRKAPGHLWPAGILSLLWNAWGTYISIAAQSGALPYLRAEEQAYFASQPLWFVIVADAGSIAGISGAVALLLQHRSAVWLYAAMFATIVLTNLYDLVAGTSPMLSQPAAIGGSVFLLSVMALQVVYARAMHRRGVLE